MYENNVFFIILKVIRNYLCPCGESLTNEFVHNYDEGEVDKKVNYVARLEIVDLHLKKTSQHWVLQ